MSLLSLGSTVSIFDPQAVKLALDKAEGQAFEGLRKVYRKMLDTGPTRYVTRPSSHSVLEGVRDLCPNFESVLDDLEGYIELALVGKGAFRVIPVLLAGEPGVGKTHFAKSLAKALSVPFSFLSMGVMSAGWQLSGSAPTWQGARHGKVAESLIDSQFANPLYLLDELDKTGGDTRYDPYGALLQLLEPETAQAVKDDYLDIEFDASSIFWVATANDISQIPDYILSRMAVYEVPRPTIEQAKTIATNIYNNLRAEHSWPFEPTLSESAMEVLTGVPPREMGKKLLDGMAQAVKAKRSVVEPRDILSSKTKTARSIGFTAPMN